MQDLNDRINEIEQEIFAGNHTGALGKLDQFLIDCAKPVGLESQFPEFKLDNIDVKSTPDISGYSIRLAAIIQALFLSDKISYDINNTRVIIHFKDWVSALFRFLPFKNTDHIISAISKDNTYSGERLWRLCALYTAESTINFDWNEFYNQNRQICMILAFSILSTSQFISGNSSKMRDDLLKIIPRLIDKVENLDSIPIELLHHAYMRCSYSTQLYKHDIKSSIVKLIRRDLLNKGYCDNLAPLKMKEKPTVVLILDWWTSTHAMFRCYSDSIKSLSLSFNLVAIAHKELVDDEALKLFNDVYPIFSVNSPIYENFTRGYEKIYEINPEVVYFPSVGMSPMTLFFSCIRSAPIQICSLGHPATTFSPFIDYMVCSPEFYGNNTAYIEPLWLLPYNMYSFSALAHLTQRKSAKSLSDSVSVAITSSVYKINPDFLNVCKSIQQNVANPVKFNFYLASVYGLQYVSAKKSILEYLPEANIYPNQDHSSYLYHLEKNDLFLCPFPFGNTNGVIDGVACGLPGICLYGSEPHAAIDSGIFKICGLPDFLVAKTPEEYINIAIKLIDSRELVGSISDAILGSNVLSNLKSTQAIGFCTEIFDMYIKKLG